MFLTLFVSGLYFSSVALARLKELSRFSFLLYRISFFLAFVELQLCHQVTQLMRSCFFMASCCPTFDLLIVFFALCCFCRNCSKYFAFLGRLYHLLLPSWFHSDHRCNPLRELCSFCLRILFYRLRRVTRCVVYSINW